MKRIIVFLMVLLLACISSFAQDPGKLLHSEIYHETDRFEFYGEVSVSERHLRIDVHENEILLYWPDGSEFSGRRYSRAEMLFSGFDDYGNRVYQMNVGGQITSFTVLKDWNIRANRRYSYSKGISLSSQTSGGSDSYNQNINYNDYQSNQPVYVVCPACGGSGRDQGRTQYYTNGGQRFCPTCGTTSLAHDHIYSRCGRCDGTGRVKQY